jgi:hypothetical protein
MGKDRKKKRVKGQSFLDKDIKISIRRDQRIFLEGMARRNQEVAERRELFNISR